MMNEESIWRPIRRDLHPALGSPVTKKSVAAWQENTNNFYIKRNVDGSLDIPAAIDDNWAGTGKAKREKSKKVRASSESGEERRITITLSNISDGYSKVARIKPSTCLRNLFTDYAEECGTPIRCLRFSFNGNTLFLSSLAGKTAKDLNLTNRDCISVTSILETPSDFTEKAESKQAEQKSAKKGTSKKQQKKKKSDKSKQITKLYETEKTAEENHSVALSKLFEEAEPIFKVIRQRLNNLSLQKKSPKARRSSDKERDESPTSVVLNPNTFGLGGKAGKSSYAVNIGQVENLYISSKHNSIHSKYSSRQNTMIDLHGCTKEQALAKLDDALVDWVDTAMKGEYPWLIPVEIVCGGGNQILSETVEGWIKCHKNVANAPKGTKW